MPSLSLQEITFFTRTLYDPTASQIGLCEVKRHNIRDIYVLMRLAALFSELSSTVPMINSIFESGSEKGKLNALRTQNKWDDGASNTSLSGAVADESIEILC